MPLRRALLGFVLIGKILFDSVLIACIFSAIRAATAYLMTRRQKRVITQLFHQL